MTVREPGLSFDRYAALRPAVDIEVQGRLAGAQAVNQVYRWRSRGALHLIPN